MHWKIKFQLREFSAWTRRLFLADVCLGHAKAQGFMRSILFILHICLDRFCRMRAAMEESKERVVWQPAT